MTAIPWMSSSFPLRPWCRAPWYAAAWSVMISAPTDDLFPYYKEVQNYSELPDILLKQIAHFFQHYKDLEPKKWTRIGDWVDAAAAERLILEGIARAKAKHP